MENKEYYKRLFPLLTNYELIIDSESFSYNCISHTINIKDKNYWPTNEYWPTNRDLSKSSFDEFYEYHGFKKLNYLDISYDPNFIKVALYSKDGIPTHASIQIDGDFWESKIGQLGIIKHDLFEIEDSVYGEVTQIYRKPKEIKERIITKFKRFGI
jgi:hypothetical protein